MTQLLPGKEKVATASRSGWMSKDDYNLLHGIPAITSVAAPLTLVAGVLGVRQPQLRLNYVAAVDLANSLALAANTWVDIGTAQSFTWTGTGSVGLCWARGNVFGGATGALLGARLLFDGTTPAVVGGGVGPNTATSAWANFLAGAQPVWLASLAAGSHTVKLQVMANVAGLAFCRPASQPNFESLGLIVVELAP